MLQLQSPQTKVPNVILFGPSGSGKSSVINMLTGEGCNPLQSITSSSAEGVTFSATPFDKLIKGERIRVFDTAGLNEGAHGTVPGIQAIESLHKLIVTMPPDGISLLVYVIRATRITVLTYQNYQMFFDTICHGEVRIVVVITGLEFEENMDDWWTVNEPEFTLYHMSFYGHACITASTKFPELYEKSRKTVEDLIFESLKDATPWMPNSNFWLADFLHKSISISPKIYNFKFLRDLSPELKSAISSYASVVNERSTSGRRRIGPTISAASMNDAARTSNIVVLVVGTEDISCYWNKDHMIHTDLQEIKLYYLDAMENDRRAMRETITTLYDELHSIHSGVNLLVLAISQSNVRDDRLHVIYKVLYDKFLQQSLPVAILITGLSLNEPAEAWWSVTKGIFDEKRIFFQNHAFLSDIQKEGLAEDVILKLIKDTYSPLPFVIPVPSGNRNYIRSFSIWRTLGVQIANLAPELYEALLEHSQMNGPEALIESNKLGRKHSDSEIQRTGTALLKAVKSFILPRERDVALV